MRRDYDNGEEIMTEVWIDAAGETETATPAAPVDLKKAFEEARRTRKWTLPFPWHCQVCGKEVRNIRTVPFCRVHKSQHAERRKRVIRTSELSHQWNDKLAHWADWPFKLDDEPDADKFEFRWPEGDWLLFERGYPNRLPDWIACNKKTKEVRRFVEVSSSEVLEDILGGNRAPRQHDLEERWGKFEEGVDLRLRMLERFEELRREPYRPPSIAAVIEKLDFPAYGLLDNFMDLNFHSFCYGGGSLGLENISFSFRYPSHDDEDAERGVWIETHLRRYRVIQQEPGHKRHQARFAAEQLWANFAPRTLREKWVEGKRSAFDEIRDLGSENIATLAFDMEDFGPSAASIGWSGGPAAFAFLVENDKVSLAVATLGLSKEEVVEIAGHIGQVSGRADILAEYQQRMDAHLDEISRRFADDGVSP